MPSNPHKIEFMFPFHLLILKQDEEGFSRSVSLVFFPLFIPVLTASNWKFATGGKEEPTITKLGVPHYPSFVMSYL